VAVRGDHGDHGEGDPEDPGPCRNSHAAQGSQAGPADKPRGHGRHGADVYDGARRVRVPLATLHAGDACPHCAKGRVYASCRPGLIVRLTGQAPIGGAVYETGEAALQPVWGGVLCRDAGGRGRGTSTTPNRRR